MNNSLVRKYSTVIHGRKTSYSLEPPFQEAIKLIAVRKNMPLWRLVEQIDIDRKHANLSSALRLYVLDEMDKAIQSRAAWLATAAAIAHPHM